MQVATAQECTICGGSGWKPVTSGGDKRVMRCECILHERDKTLLANARIPVRYSGCELDNLKLDGVNSSIEAAKISAAQFVEAYPLEKRGLLLVGPVGVGKTHISVGIIKELIRRKSVRCLFYDYRQLLKEIQNSYNPSVQTTELEVLRPVFETEVLLLDELGAVKPTDWVWDAVSLILNTRYNDNRTIIITTNFEDKPAAMVNGPRLASREETLGDRIGERMRSRLHEMCRKVELQGKDFRERVQSASFR